MVATTAPASGSLGPTPATSNDEPWGVVNVNNGEGVIVNTIGASLSPNDPATDTGRADPGAGEQACSRYSSSALTIEFASGSVSASNGTGVQRVYNATPDNRVVAEIRGTNSDRFEGPAGSYNDSLSTDVTGSALDLGANMAGSSGCVVARAGVSPIPFDTRPVSNPLVVAHAAGIVSFTGAADADGDVLSCRGGSSDDKFRRGGVGAPSTPGDRRIELKLHDIRCTVFRVGADSPAVIKSRLDNPDPKASLTSPVTVIAHLRIGPGLIFFQTVCNSGIAPVACSLDWAWTDLS